MGSAVYGLRQGFLANRNRATLLPLCFTVTSGTGAPTITNFSPTSGIPGTQVTVTGTGFDPTPINDVVKVNLSPASISAATASSLGITVPNSVASGHISVRTKAGTATSTQDFYVPFGTHLVTDIGFTGRMTANSTNDLDHATSVTSPQGTISYTSDAIGRRQTMTVSGQPQITYSYDAGNRVIQVTQGTASVSLAMTRSVAGRACCFPMEF